MRFAITATHRTQATTVALMTIAAGAWGASLKASAPATDGVVQRVERTAWLMGTRAAITVDAADRASALSASEAAIAAMAGVEDRLSTWRDDSELSVLNRTPPGAVARASAEVAALLAETATWSDLTDGAFHPAVGALIDAWDLRGNGRVPGDTELREALAATGAAGVLIDPANGSVVRNDDTTWLDAGAFGKGAALRAARQALQAAGVSRARIDLGGQILSMGDTAIQVSVADPVHREQHMLSLAVRDASVATSGQSQRGVEVDGVRFGHLIDPRTGRPVAAWGSATVVHEDPVAADILATALFVLGPEAGFERAEALGVAALFIVSDGAGVSTRMTPGFTSSSAVRPGLEATLPTP